MNTDVRALVAEIQFTASEARCVEQHFSLDYCEPGTWIRWIVAERDAQGWVPYVYKIFKKGEGERVVPRELGKGGAVAASHRARTSQIALNSLACCW